LNIKQHKWLVKYVSKSGQHMSKSQSSMRKLHFYLYFIRSIENGIIVVPHLYKRIWLEADTQEINPDQTFYFPMPANRDPL